MIWVLVYFLLRNAYFIGFELHTGAATIGKRVLGLRVATRNGGRLTADAVFARNAMREMEFYLPLSFIFAAPREQVDAWMTLAGLVWSGVFVLFPLFNNDRLRVGDLVAGTWVVQGAAGGGCRRPRPRRRRGAGLRLHRRSSSTPTGSMELQVLEDVLRRSDRTTMRAVAARIRSKIGWTARADETDRAFLDAYYAALRAQAGGRPAVRPPPQGQVRPLMAGPGANPLDFNRRDRRCRSDAAPWQRWGLIIAGPAVGLALSLLPLVRISYLPPSPDGLRRLTSLAMVMYGVQSLVRTYYLAFVDAVPGRSGICWALRKTGAHPLAVSPETLSPPVGHRPYLRPRLQPRHSGVRDPWIDGRN